MRKSRPETSDGETVTQAADKETVDLPALPASVTSEAFDLYVAVDDEAQTAADVSDGELCADQQSAAEADGSDDEPSEETSAPGGDQTPPVTFTVTL